ncbi:MAG TPA: Rrf2 family transcriptional regulator [Solirubrobacteraceae bacterium]
MRISARVDYAVRAAVELAAAGEDGGLVTAEAVSRAQDIPHRFLDHILASLRHAGLVESRRGPEGGHRLARPPEEITVAEIIRAIDGPLASVGGTRPDQLDPPGAAAPMRDVWVAVRASLRQVLEEVSIADVAQGSLPDVVRELAADADAWSPH